MTVSQMSGKIQRRVDWVAHKEEGVLPAVVAVALSPSFLPHVAVVDGGRHVPTRTKNGPLDQQSKKQY